ncbi:GNAT family N-acetyltransferase [Pseudoalteromonas tetraodonis]|uniref:GNAT family N-acetyltransferase n=1 Tax=Pseudoalteromonas tetraodonis TaxID=43659 RepID=UPI003EBBB129
MHAHYYATVAEFGREFACSVASSMAEFIGRLDNPSNEIWTIKRDDKIPASVAIDGEDLGHNRAHLRWFIVDDSLRSFGLGKQLLNSALAFADAQGFVQINLWTFSGLNAARYLYESQGFALVEEKLGSQWGIEVLEQRFTRYL